MTEQQSASLALKKSLMEIEVTQKSLFRKNFNFDKKELIDFVFGRKEPKAHSFADLGGVWGVDGAYTFYSLDRYDVAAAFLVDTDFTAPAAERAAQYPALQLIRGNFGAAENIKRIGNVEALFMFDILLHQVSPNWDDILAMYSLVADCFVIYNQQWVATERTLRLLDLGKEEYFRNVPHSLDHETYKALFEHMDEMHPTHKRLWRDIHNVWQWGITDRDLTRKMEGLGYGLHYYKNCGRFGRLPNFENHGFVFRRR